MSGIFFRLAFGASPRHMLSLTAALGIVFGAVMLALPPDINAAPTAGYVVDSTADQQDIDPSDSICQAPNGHCTLRAAIMQVNHAGHPPTITLPAGIYVLTRSGFDDDALQGDLDILQNTTILGAGQNTTIIDGNRDVTADRVFQILKTAPNVTLSNVTIRNGIGPTGTFPTLLGGGIYREADFAHGFSPVLILNNVLLENNSAEDGGGLYNSGGLIELDNTTVHANRVTNRGGGVFAGDTYVTINDSKVYSNSAYSGGGIAFNNAFTSKIMRTEFFSNSVNSSGGAFSHINTAANQDSTIAVQYSSLHDNYSAARGGAIDNFAALFISRTILSANRAGQTGGALMVYQTLYPSRMVIAESTLSANAADYGGAIYYNDFGGATSSLTIINSTLSDNVVAHDGGAVYVIGDAHVGLYNATVADNHADRVGLGTARGAGLFITGTALITAQNTLLGDNRASVGSGLPKESDCYGLLLSLNYNLIETDTNCLIGGFTSGNLIGLSPVLGPLQNNGGPMIVNGQAPQTRALQFGSPAIDAGDPGGCRSSTGAFLATDERGFLRSINGRCDIGAFEYSPYALDLPLIRR